MNRLASLASAVTIAGLAATATAVFQDASQMSPQEEVQMLKWMEYATPGEEQAFLAQRVGKWKVSITHWMPLPGAIFFGKPCRFKATEIR